MLFQLLYLLLNKNSLNKKQDKIIEYILEKDYLGAENSLRIAERSPIIQVIDKEKCGRVAYSGDLWSGRIYTKELVVPTTTSIPPYYIGIENPFLSKNEKKFINSLWYEPGPVEF